VALKTRDIGKSKHKQHKTASVWADSPVMKNLENRFETKVNIKGSEKQGRIEITFSSPEDMTRIVDLLLHSEQTAEGTQTDWV
jgi:ParB family chromosome partitioning protein